jgi:hypothetical protein
MIIMEPAERAIEVAPLLAANRIFTRYSLSDQPHAPKAVE